MILIEPGEEVDFMFRASAKIDGRKVGSGWFYSTDRRLVFESDKHGVCFSVKPTDVDGQKAQRWGRFKFTWVEETARGPWRFLFEGKIEKWNGWKPSSAYVEWVLQDASYSKQRLLSAGWRTHKGTIYNQLLVIGEMVPEMSGKTPEEQRLYRIWRTAMVMGRDGDYDLLRGKYDNNSEEESLVKLNVQKIKTARAWLVRYTRDYQEALEKAESASDDSAGQAALEREGITPESLEEMRIKWIVQERIIQIVKSEYSTYTFGKQLNRRADELRPILTEMCMSSEDISGIVPPTKVESAMIQARKDIEEFRQRLAVKLPLAV